jgi:hypothetical protein
VTLWSAMNRLLLQPEPASVSAGITSSVTPLLHSCEALLQFSLPRLHGFVLLRLALKAL